MNRLLTFTISIWWAFACEKSIKAPPGFGLNTYDLWISAEDLSELYSSTFEDTPVPVEVHYNGEYKLGSIFHTGNSTVLHPKRSYELHLKGDFLIQGHGKVRLSAQAFDTSALRSLLGYQVFKSLGILTPGIEPVALYLNGHYQGLYFQVDKITGSFLEDHGQKAASLYKARFGRLGFAGFEGSSYNDLEVGYKIEIGNKEFADLKHLITLVHEPDSTANAKDLEAALDIDNYLRYLAGAVVLNHWDGFYNNYYLYQEEASRRFRFVAWDVDQIYKPDTMQFTAGKTVYGRNALSEKIFRNPAQRKQYLDIMHELLTVSFPAGAMSTFLEEQKSLIREAYDSDPFLAGKSLDHEVEELQLIFGDWLNKILADLKVEQDR
ncbi:MAG TPA: CotH kinase family protein [Oligoflexus sp.]|nr:CotH kinase family protein [Oligoflexus sp.]